MISKRGQQRTKPEAVRLFLDKHVSTRRFLIILTAVVAPATLVLLTYADYISISKPAAFAAAVAITVIAIVLGGLLAFTETSTGEIAGALIDADERLRKAEERVRRDKLSQAKLEAQFEQDANQLNAISVLRERLFFLINLALEACYQGGVLSVSRATSLFLAELGGLAPYLFRLVVDERWSCAIYLLDEERQVLVCVGDVRNSSKDDGEGHRSWPVGRGMVGVTAFTGRVLIVADTTASDLEGMIRDPDERRAAEDRAAYRSVAAVPIYKPEGRNSDASDDDPQKPSIYGVVIATSDHADRFQTEADEEFLPLQALADAVAMVLIAEGLSKKLVEAAALGKGPDSGKGPQDIHG